MNVSRVQGRVAESLEVALEKKDITAVLWVLRQQQSSFGAIENLIEKCAEVG